MYKWVYIYEYGFCMEIKVVYKTCKFNNKFDAHQQHIKFVPLKIFTNYFEELVEKSLTS